MKIKKLLKEIGLESTEELGSWNGYDVKVATSSTIMHLGLPQFILTKDEDSRWASPEETIQLMNIFCV